MDSFGELFLALSKHGPGFITAAIMGVFYYWERKRNAELVDRLHRLAVANLEADQAHTRMYDSINSALTVLIDVIKR